MSRLSHLLLDMAAWIAPPHRRQWIAGMRAEADQSTAWAWGAVTTAVGQRLADTMASGLALRLAAGGFVIGVAVSFALFLAMRLPRIEAAAAYTHKAMPVLAAMVLLLLSGGLAVLLSHGVSWLNRYGRTLFALGSLYIGGSLSGAAFMDWHRATAFRQQTALLSTLAGPLFIAAALALLFRRRRLFLITTSGALGLQIVQYGLRLPHLHPLTLPHLAIFFFNACAPGLLMLAATGLLLERKTHVTV